MNTPKPVYVLHGTDAFLRDAHRQEILQAVVGDADPQIAVAVYDADAELAAVLDDLRTLPFLAARKAVCVRNADAFITAHREAMEKYLQAPVESASLILEPGSWPKNTRLFKLVEKIGQTVDCSFPQHGNLRAWLTAAADRRGKNIAPDAAELLGEWIGRDLKALDGEIEKLSLYAADRKTITLADVSALVTASAGPASFALSDALTAQDIPAALRALGGMLIARGEEFKTLGFIAWHLRRVMRASQMVADGKSIDVTMTSLRIFHNKPQFAQLLKRRPGRKLIADFRRLLAADRAMKTGSPPRVAMEQLVVGLCS